MQVADPNGFLACWGEVIDCGAINACTTWRFDRLVGGGVVANRTAMAPLQVLDNDTFSPDRRAGYDPNTASPQEVKITNAVRDTKMVRHSAGDCLATTTSASAWAY